MKGRTLGAALIIAGTCIGAGMLALPLATASSGFLFSMLFLLFCWFMMWLTGLYVLEANLPLSADANFISMARTTLGPWGETLAWASYLLLLYSLMAAYLTAGGGMVTSLIKLFYPSFHEVWQGPLLWVLVIGAIVYLGLRHVDRLNRFLMVGLLITYAVLITFIAPHVSLVQLVALHPHVAWGALPVVVAAFGYHVVIPSLRRYMDADIDGLKRVIFWGSAAPILFYLLWEAIVFGALPLHGLTGLLSIAQSSAPATALTHQLSKVVGHSGMLGVADSFLFFAIASSFVGISMSLFDFLADGLKIRKSYLGRVWIGLLTFIPPLLYAEYFPQGFLLAISYAGVFVAILHGILPAAMVWVRRRRGQTRYYKAPGGVLAIGCVMLFSFAIIGAELYF